MNFSFCTMPILSVLICIQGLKDIFFCNYWTQLQHKTIIGLPSSSLYRRSEDWTFVYLFGFCFQIEDENFDWKFSKAQRLQIYSLKSIEYQSKKIRSSVFTDPT